MELTDDKGVDYIFDSVGSELFYKLLNTVKLCGHVINYGQSSGPIKPFEISILAKKSLSLSRPILFHFIYKREKYESMATNAFTMFEEKALRYPGFESYPLENASQAHEMLESRSGGGSVYLVPSNS